MKKLAIVTTHPIQYNAPFFKLLTERGKVYPKVFYTWPQAIDGFEDPDFGKKVQWDIPLLEGYDWEAVENVSKKPSSKYWGGIDCPDLIGKIEAFNPDAVFVYGWNLKSHFKTMRYFKGRKKVWFFGDSTLLDEQPGIKKVLRRLWLTWIYRYVDKGFYVGTNNRAYFVAHGLKDDKLAFFPHAVDNDRFSDSKGQQYEKKARDWRKKLGYSVDDKVVLFTGKLESKKNPLFLLEAIIQIHRSTDLPIHLLFVGNGQLETELKEKSKNDPFIKFMPFQNQSIMPVVYRLGDIFCLPSQGPGETWGLAVNEAMASARPILVSDKVGCAKDLSKNFSDVAVFNSNNYDDLSEKLRKLIQFDLLNLGQQSELFISNWSLNKKCDTLEQNIYAS